MSRKEAIMDKMIVAEWKMEKTMLKVRRNNRILNITEI